MKDASDFTKDTGIPLNTDIIEQIPVRKITVDSVDEKTGIAKYSVKTVLEQQTARYINVPKVKVRCNKGEHVFKVADIKKYIFACTKCQFACKVYPTSYRFDVNTGKLINTKTGATV